MPYSPGVTPIGGQLLAQGIGRGASQLAGLGLNMAEENKRKREEFEALSKYADAAGYGDKDTTTTMSLEQLKGFVRGKEFKAVQEEKAMDDRRLKSVADAQIANFTADNLRAEAAAKRSAEQQDATGRMYGMLAAQAGRQGPNADGSSVGEVQWSDIVRTAMEAGFKGSPADLKAVADLIEGQRKKSDDLSPAAFDEDPITGARFARSGRSILPSGTNPAKQQTTPEPMTGPNGELLGYVIRSPRGGFQTVKPPAEALIEVDLDPENPGSTKAKMTVREYEQRFRKTIGNRGGTNAPAGSLSFDDFSNWRKR